MAIDSNGCGKGDTPRPRLVSQEEYDVRYELAYGDVSDDRRRELHNKLDKLIRQRRRQ
jgi:hypothetical protein